MSPLFGPSAESVLSRGTPAQGTIVGIRIGWSHDDPPQRLDEYAVSAGDTVYGVRQQLSPDADVRLGMSVGLRVDGKAAVIEWGSLETRRWKTLGTPPAAGIEDDGNGMRAARAKWIPAAITIVAITERSVMLGMATVHDVSVHVTPSGQASYETVLKNIQPAHYATHLFAPGTDVSGWVNPSRLDTVLIDWAASAVDAPGVGATSVVPQKTGGLFGGGATSVGAAAPSAAVADEPPIELPGFMKNFGFTSTSPDEVADDVSWEAFIAVFRATGSGAIQGAEADAIAVQHGIAAGEWDAAQTRWMNRIAKDMKLGIAFGKALNG